MGWGLVGITPSQLQAGVKMGSDIISKATVQTHSSQSHPDDDSLKRGERLTVNENHVLQDRKIGVLGAISLIVNKIIGAGIFSTPSTIFKLSGSVGLSLLLWVIAGIISACGALVMLEFGSGIPRSGGIKVYLERSFAPKRMQTCIYLFFCLFLQVSASNAITAAEYLLSAAGVESTTWKERGLAIAAVSFAVGVHTVAPRVGRAMQDVLSMVKLFTLLFIVCTGFAALAGHLRIPKPHNFDLQTSFEGTSNNGYDIGTALLDAIFSYQGYDNVNAVLSEVKNPEHTLRIALPCAMGIITVLYVLANVAYFAGVPKEEFRTASVTIAASLFRNVFGETAATRALPALVALSALGHLLGVAFVVPRLLQELAKDGIAPFPDIMMQNRPFKTPIAALIVHLGVTVLFICAPPAGDAFSFVVGLSSYPMCLMLTAITVGLVRMRLTRTGEGWSSSYPAPWPVIGFYLAANTFLLAMPFVPPNSSASRIPYWLSPVVALGILGLGVVYYLLRFAVLPWLFGYSLHPVTKDLTDGSQVTRFLMLKEPR
ncbi:amino acid transporter [Aspergillus brunneoviolaceus CBS 621.78]|uniref:Amino acid transporter n=1 Tax=Aspergillus brunneoviolaceus CBS 621.78 TaxID=1450534 RepID=A0ACD1G349_9EURO|nr:amino acid transporter [Aspergillus brunneoviolaceus CBS 621.78]RAH43656.1 amino acid transporter [Aspergillus brunneoviolaceus CBS 621.78]